MDEKKQRELVSALAGISLPMWEKVKSLVDWQFEARKKTLALGSEDELGGQLKGKLDGPGVDYRTRSV